MRTGQDHISRAFMCANTRLFYLSPNMRAARSSRAHQAHSCPDSHQNIHPCHPARALQTPQKCPSAAFLFSCLSGIIHPCLRQPSSPIAGARVDLTRQEIELVPKLPQQYMMDVLLCFSKVYFSFSPRAILAAPPSPRLHPSHSRKSL